MTPQHEEAARMLRMARMDEAAFIALLGLPAVALAVALFHAQQAMEKALKSVMCLHGVELLRTHDLEELAARLVDAGLAPPVGVAELQRLTPYAVKYRYVDTAPNIVSVAVAKNLTATVASVLAWAESVAVPGPA